MLLYIHQAIAKTSTVFPYSNKTVTQTEIIEEHGRTLIYFILVIKYKLLNWIENPTRHECQLSSTKSTIFITNKCLTSLVFASAINEYTQLKIY